MDLYNTEPQSNYQSLLSMATYGFDTDTPNALINVSDGSGVSSGFNIGINGIGWEKWINAKYIASSDVATPDANSSNLHYLATEKFAYKDSSATVWTIATEEYVNTVVSANMLPSQTGNAGKYLTTDGVDPSWGAINALPDQTGNNGKVITTDGTDASWATVQSVLGYTPISNVLASGNILVGSAGAVATSRAMSGDVTISNTGVTAIGAGKVTNSMLQNSSITLNGASISLGGTRILALASSDFVNQGTATTVLHGNASGNPTWGKVALATDISGILGSTNGGTGVNNGSSTITIGGNVNFVGAHTFTGNITGNTSVLFPTTGTLATLAGTETFTNKSGNISMWTNDSGYLTTITGIAAGGELSGTYPNPTLLNSAVIGKVLTGLNVTGSTIVSTDTILQAFGKTQNMINGLIGGVLYKGTWAASTNTPTLANGTGTQGNYYVASDGGTVNFGAGAIVFNTGDWAIYNGSIWQKVDNTDAVTSVNGYIGAVNLTTADIPEVTNLYYTNARGIGSTLTGYSSGAGTVSSSDSILQAIQKLNGNTAALVTGVSSVSGTSNRITVSPTTGAAIVDISASYVGQTSITTLGTIGTGTWQGSVVGTTYGGSGTSTTFTQGSVVIAGASGVYTESINNFVYDATNNFLTINNIGGGTATYPLAVYGLYTDSGTVPVRGLGVFTNVARTSADSSASFVQAELIATIGAANTKNWTGSGVGVVGALGRVSVNSGATGTITIATGVLGRVANAASGATITNAYAIRVESISNSGTITSAAAIAAPNITAATNNTQLLLGTLTIPSGNWGIYNSNTSLNYFAGNIAIAGTTGTELLSLGANSGTIGSMSFYGSTSGKVVLTTNVAAGSWTLTLPTDAGTSGYVLSTDGAGVTSWIPGSAGAVTSVTGTTNRITSTGGSTPVIDISASYIGQTSITTLGTITTGTLGSGSKILVGSDATGDMYYNGGSGAITRLAAVASGSVLISAGTGTAPAYSSSPTLTTSLTVPIVYGGTAVGSSLLLKGTSNGSPTTDFVALYCGGFETARTAASGVGFLIGQTTSTYSSGWSRYIIMGDSTNNHGNAGLDLVGRSTATADDLMGGIAAYNSANTAGQQRIASIFFRTGTLVNSGTMVLSTMNQSQAQRTAITINDQQQVTFGVNSGSVGCAIWAGNTSGSATITVNATATQFNINKNIAASATTAAGEVFNTVQNLSSTGYASLGAVNSTGAGFYVSAYSASYSPVGTLDIASTVLFSIGLATNMFLANNAYSIYQGTSGTPLLRAGLTSGGDWIVGNQSGTFGFNQGKLKTDNAAVTGLVAGSLAALTTASIVIYDSTGQAYRVPCVI